MIARIFALTGLVMATCAAADDGADLELTIDGIETPVTLGWSSGVSGKADYPSAKLVLMQRGEGEDEGDLLMVSLGIETFRGKITHVEARLTRQIDDEQLPPRFCYDELERGGLTVDLDEFTETDSGWTVVGQFSCAFGSTENFGRDIDLDDAIEVSGSFNTTLEHAE